MTDKEIEKHNKIIKQIEDATTIDDLPKITYSKLSTYLATNVYFNDFKLKSSDFIPVVDAIFSSFNGSFKDENVKRAFVEVLITYYPGMPKEDIINMYIYILENGRVDSIVEEINAKNRKLELIQEKNAYNNHQEVIRRIRSTVDIKDLPKVGLSELNRRLIKNVNSNDYVTNFKISDIKILTDACLEEFTYSNIKVAVSRLCMRKYFLNKKDRATMCSQIFNAIMNDYELEFLAEEIEEKERQKLYIYKIEHEDTMDAIHEATRISELPQKLTFSTLTHYLNGNSTIYSGDMRTSVEDFNDLAILLLSEKTFDDIEVKEEVKKIAEGSYSEEEDAYELLFNKLSRLPRIYYLVEEINYALSRQKEFIGNRSSNVNVYFIPNDKGPTDAGRFYNCYISRVQNLDLSKILPLNLNEIVPKGLDIDSVEWFVRENYDKTFKAAGGIILNKDETIGNVSVFRPNDGKVGVTPEEKEKVDKLSDFDSELNSIIEDFNAYKAKVLALQNEMLDSIESIKNKFSSTDVKKKELK